MLRLPFKAVGTFSTPPPPRRLGDILRLLGVSMRPPQWTKNLFVLAPLIFGMKLGSAPAIRQALLACGSFCLLASALYIFNDIIDAPADRAHPEKRSRPIASGALPIRVAGLAAIALLGMAYGLATILGGNFLALAIAYSALTFTYCVGLKRLIILDCMTIAAGFVLRVVGGAIAIDVTPSHWLLVCAFLLALYLAFTKRRQELLLLSDEARQHRRVLGEYTVEYLEQTNSVILAVVIVCYALYTVAPETIARFGTDKLIYSTIFVLYGLLRYTSLIRDPNKGGNPSKLLLEDTPLIVTIIGWLIYNTLIIYHHHIVQLWNKI
jgi:4-hydroxybenzoate polyprenyltransferase